MIGLDVTHGALLTPAWAERFRGAGRVGTFVAELVEFFKQYHAAHLRLGRRPDPRRGGARALLPARDRPHRAPQRRGRAGVGAECRGRTVVDRWHRTDRAPNAQVGIEIDADAFLDLLLERIATLG